MLNLKYRRTWLTLGTVCVAAAIYVCLAPPATPALAPIFAVNDKVEHAVGYFLLSLLFSGMYPRSRYKWIALALFAMGVAIELLQGWMSLGREADVRDVVANSIGIGGGLLVAVLALGGWAERVEAWLSTRGR